MINFGFWVSLRRLESSDIDLYLDVRNSYLFRVGARQFDLITSDDVRDLLNNKNSKIFSIIHRGSEKGICSFTDINHIHQRAEFSIFINGNHHREGIGELALQTLFCHGFKNLNLNVIYGETFSENVGAHRLFSKIGMAWRPGIDEAYYKNGKFIDSHIIFMTKSSFLDREWSNNEQR